MPLFDYVCIACDAVHEHLARPGDVVRECDDCGGPAERQMGVPVVFADSITPYYDHGLGATVESRTQKNKLMAEKSLAPSDKPLAPHGTKGTIFSFSGQATTSVKPSGYYAKRYAHGVE